MKEKQEQHKQQVQTVSLIAKAVASCHVLFLLLHALYCCTPAHGGDGFTIS
jgi:hypothetical protein